MRPLAVLYGAVAERRRLQTTPVRLGVPVIVVGNLVVGGAGKTPTTVALVQALMQRGFKPGVVSRGFGRRDGTVVSVTAKSEPDDVGDEPLLIHRRTQAPVVVGASRVDAARSLLQLHPQVDVIVADDGLQHHALARDAQLIVIDERGFGNGLLLPAGPLRERPGAQPPPRSVVVYNHDSMSTAWPGHLCTRSLRGALPLAKWRRGAVAGADDLRQLGEQPITAAAGVAVPKRFFAMLSGLGLKFEALPLPDHFDWIHPPRIPDDHALIVTEKDAVKIAATHALAERTWVAPLDLQLPAPVIDQLVAWVRGAARAPRPRPST